MSLFADYENRVSQCYLALKVIDRLKKGSISQQLAKLTIQKIRKKEVMNLNEAD
ncbi:hypothetical protein KIN20_004516 [Parelaphostrongylus tenuis]|uniref:Uncharacterized protein n=1 Tax=Parelaphostrongylus tenuis TaxID=148309 RepID=A0AAD5MHE0_PARTN|nr:hypothetical protein KIN20_004516 [Parelaphostrongylus tenuis]